MTRLVTALAAFSLVFLVVGCGGDDDPTQPPPGTGESDLVCTSPALSSPSAQPFDMVAVTGIAGVGDATYASFETAGGATGLTPVIVTGKGAAEIVVPPNPDDLMNGGTLWLTVTDGIKSCEPLELDVLPIDPAIGDPLGDVDTTLRNLAAAFVAEFGIDAGVVASTSLGDLSPQAIPVAILLEAGEAFDPVAIMNGMKEDEAAFLQAVVAKSGLVASLSGVLASMTGQPGPAARPEFAESRVPTDKECGDLGTVPANLFDLSGPEELSDYIKAARGAGDSLGPLSQAISNTGTAFAVMGLAVPPVGAVAGYLAFTANLVQQMRANLYPSAITHLEYQLSDDRIEEDWDTTRGDPPIKWSFAKVWATNNGMGLARVGIDLITTVAALPDGFSGAVDAAIGVADIAGKEALNKRLDELQKDPDGGAECWGIGATEFGPVVIDDNTGDTWVNAEITTGEAVSVDGTDVRKLNPEKIGTATLRVRTQPDPFPGPFGFEDKQVEVLRKEVVWIPTTLLVQNPGQPETIKFRIDDAKHDKPEDVMLTVGPNLPPMTPTYSGGVHTITFTTPSEKDQYPTWVEVCSTSKELPPDSPDRCARIQIFADEWVKIDQKDVCVGNGDSEPLTATAGGPGEPVIRWEIESGAGDLSPDSGETIDYIAPSTGSGQVTLRAYLSTNGDIEDRITFSYGQCSGLAVYYGNVAEINFPFGAGGQCDNPDLDAQYEEFTFPEDGFLPEVLPAAGDIWVGRTERFNRILSDGGSFGDIPPGSQNCNFGTWNAMAEYDGTLTGSPDGTRVDFDIITATRTNCIDLGTDLGNECSSAGATMQLGGRFDFDITAAANYRLNVDLTCTFEVPQGFPAITGLVSILAIQIEPDGTLVQVNATTQPIQVQCQSGVPLVIDQLMQFPAPSSAGQTDHVMVMFTMDNTSFGALETIDSGEVSRSGSLAGYISVEKE
jgi:hypothetical protein